MIEPLLKEKNYDTNILSESSRHVFWCCVACLILEQMSSR